MSESTALPRRRVRRCDPAGRLGGEPIEDWLILLVLVAYFLRERTKDDKGSLVQHSEYDALYRVGAASVQGIFSRLIQAAATNNKRAAHALPPVDSPLAFGLNRCDVRVAPTSLELT